jgi:rhodanese-related sulfurtransferase
MSNRPTVVDVRTLEEFAEGHVPGSINLPLHELPARFEELRGLPEPLIMCCRSGVRSDHAMHFLLEQGFTDVQNGGPWQNVQAQLHGS